MKKFWFKKAIMFLLIFAAAVTTFGFVVMGLWNAILPAVLGVKAITFWRAMGILVLSKIFIRRFPRPGWLERPCPGKKNETTLGYHDTRKSVKI